MKIAFVMTLAWLVIVGFVVHAITERVADAMDAQANRIAAL